MTWPADRFSVQVLDDSTDADTRALVADVCAAVRASTGVDCSVRHRADRRGYKAGALEDGRRATDAEFLVIFDSDFVPPKDFLLRSIPHFYSADGELVDRLALVQTQWGHLNHDESPLTLAQSLWVDDHHTLQMSWRSAKWKFVNFTGTAGVWRASAIESVGGWRAASLVEDCEISFRHLFAGYRTKFVKGSSYPPNCRRPTRRTRPSSDAGHGGGCSCRGCTCARCCLSIAAPRCADASRLSHVHLVAMAGVGHLGYDAAGDDPHRSLVRIARHRDRSTAISLADRAVYRPRSGAGFG